MKTHQTLIFISAALFFSLGPVNAVQAFQENFDFGALDQNLTVQAPPGFTYTVGTNADGNGVLRLQFGANYGGEGDVTTAFDAIGDFTNTVTVQPDYPSLNNGTLGVKMLATQGYAAVYWVNWSQLSAEINFPTVSTNAHWGPPTSSVVLEIRRTGSTLFLGCYSAGVYRRLLTASDSTFTQPVKLQLFLTSNSSGGSGSGNMFDDFVITADQFNPTPIPRLRTAITTAAFQISWPSYSNWTYQVWYSTALNPNAWAPLGSPTNGTGYTMGVLDWVSGKPQRFYQVIGTPPP